MENLLLQQPTRCFQGKGKTHHGSNPHGHWRYTSQGCCCEFRLPVDPLPMATGGCTSQRCYEGCPMLQGLLLQADHPTAALPQSNHRCVATSAVANLCLLACGEPATGVLWGDLCCKVIGAMAAREANQGCRLCKGAGRAREPCYKSSSVLQGSLVLRGSPGCKRRCSRRCDGASG